MSIKMKDVVKVGLGFIAGGLYVCTKIGVGTATDQWYVQIRKSDGELLDIGKPLFDPSANNKEEAPE